MAASPGAGSRRRVLDALRRSAPVPVPQPGAWRGSVAGTEQAGAVRLGHWLTEAGARMEQVESEARLGALLAGYAPFAAARRIVSTIPGIVGAEVSATPSSDPHGYADVDVAIARGEFGVAENGAIWVRDDAVPHRSLYVLAQHLVLVVPADAIVVDLHAAYDRIERATPAPVRVAWQGFIAGPSKTADIEQALVIGAHGPRSLLVVLVGTG